MKTLIASTLLFASMPAFAQQFECRGRESGNFYDLTVIDVGDEEGEVTVNNGGAPQHFRAEYSETESGGRFIFGFEAVNEGLAPDLSVLELAKKASGWAGRVEYFEHDSSSQAHHWIREKLTCTELTGN